MENVSTTEYSSRCWRYIPFGTSIFQDGASNILLLPLLKILLCWLPLAPGNLMGKEFGELAPTTPFNNLMCHMRCQGGANQEKKTLCEFLKQRGLNAGTWGDR